jgi:hypothetical protein
MFFKKKVFWTQKKIFSFDGSATEKLISRIDDMVQVRDAILLQVSSVRLLATCHLAGSATSPNIDDEKKKKTSSK